MSIDIITLKDEHRALLSLFDNYFAEQSDFTFKIKQESLMEIDDFSLTYGSEEDRRQAKHLSLEKNILQYMLRIATLKTDFQDYHYNEKGLAFWDRNEAQSYLNAEGLCQDSDDWQSLFEMSHQQYEIESEGFPEFKTAIMPLITAFNMVAYNGRDINWEISYTDFLCEMRSAFTKLTENLLFSARYHAGLTLIDNPKGVKSYDTPSVQRVQRALELSADLIDEIEKIEACIPKDHDKAIKRMLKPTPFLQYTLH